MTELPNPKEAVLSYYCGSTTFCEPKPTNLRLFHGQLVRKFRDTHRPGKIEIRSLEHPSDDSVVYIRLKHANTLSPDVAKMFSEPLVIDKHSTKFDSILPADIPKVVLQNFRQDSLFGRQAGEQQRKIPFNEHLLRRLLENYDPEVIQGKASAQSVLNVAEAPLKRCIWNANSSVLAVGRKVAEKPYFFLEKIIASDDAIVGGVMVPLLKALAAEYSAVLWVMGVDDKNIEWSEKESDGRWRAGGRIVFWIGAGDLEVVVPWVQKIVDDADGKEFSLFVGSSNLGGVEKRMRPSDLRAGQCIALLAFDKNNIAVSPLAAEFLNSLNPPIYITAFTGSGRSGKSFLASTFIKETGGLEKDPFISGTGTNGITHGIDVSFIPYPYGPGTILVLDCETYCDRIDGGCDFKKSLDTSVTKTIFLENLSFNPESPSDLLDMLRAQSHPDPSTIADVNAGLQYITLPHYTSTSFQKSHSKFCWNLIGRLQPACGGGGGEEVLRSLEKAITQVLVDRRVAKDEAERLKLAVETYDPVLKQKHCAALSRIRELQLREHNLRNRLSALARTSGRNSLSSTGRHAQGQLGTVPVEIWSLIFGYLTVGEVGKDFGKTARACGLCSYDLFVKAKNFCTKIRPQWREDAIGRDWSRDLSVLGDAAGEYLNTSILYPSVMSLDNLKKVTSPFTSLKQVILGQSIFHILDNNLLDLTRAPTLPSVDFLEIRFEHTAELRHSTVQNIVVVFPRLSSLFLSTVDEEKMEVPQALRRQPTKLRGCWGTVIYVDMAEDLVTYLLAIPIRTLKVPLVVNSAGQISLSHYNSNFKAAWEDTQCSLTALLDGSTYKDFRGRRSAAAGDLDDDALAHNAFSWQPFADSILGESHLDLPRDGDNGGGGPGGPPGGGGGAPGSGPRPPGSGGQPGGSPPAGGPETGNATSDEVESSGNEDDVEALEGEDGFVGSLDCACREFVNRYAVCTTGSTKSPELLAKYCNQLLRKGNKQTDDADIDKQADKVMTVFKYVEDKDVFQKFYSQQLAKQFVFHNSAREDVESNMMQKLKEACGYEYTSKLQRMFTDIGLSKDMESTFQTPVKKTHDKDDLLDFSVLVLGTASWPLTVPKTEFNIAAEMLKTYAPFECLNTQKHSGRKLTWLFHLSRGKSKTNHVKFNNKSSYVPNVTAYQCGKGLGTVEQPILRANPILQWFGNAQTIRNNNSSRFGNFISIEFNPAGQIVGANINWYLLEKSRVTHQTSKERNYHIFCHFLKEAAQKLNDRILVDGSVKEYRFVKKSNKNIDGVDDAAGYVALDALQIMQFTEEDQQDLVRSVAAILHLGDITVPNDRKDQAHLYVSAQSVRGKVCRLLGSPAAELVKTLLKSKIKADRDWLKQARNMEEVLYSVEALSRCLYERMFGKSVDKIIASPSGFIGVLDIDGFQIFEVGVIGFLLCLAAEGLQDAKRYGEQKSNFEQLCINYTNEKLEQFFKHHMFILKGIEWKFVHFGLHLQPMVELHRHLRHLKHSFHISSDIIFSTEMQSVENSDDAVKEFERNDTELSGGINEYGPNSFARLRDLKKEHHERFGEVVLKVYEKISEGGVDEVVEEVEEEVGGEEC
ncbi:hypothetical protein HK097_001240 [Rhizophlyctis rosea]|uniref:Uncharacterized protein n=1 Tax=Rhizophlyctis rosea TaxID=64517 RepID=A0AAD5SGY1_9FUNG|nr:hypothetical protein HK097_001240 [Rhizophlyctis rosea]